MSKWWNIDLSESDSIKFRQYLLDNNYKFETSGCFELVHFEIFLTADEAAEVDKWLDENIFVDCITNMNE